jgi:hypothetical protein
MLTQSDQSPEKKDSGLSKILYLLEIQESETKYWEGFLEDMLSHAPEQGKFFLSQLKLNFRKDSGKFRFLDGISYNKIRLMVSTKWFDKNVHILVRLNEIQNENRRQNDNNSHRSSETFPTLG